jgi:hypothetical protein
MVFKIQVRRALIAVAILGSLAENFVAMDY